MNFKLQSVYPILIVILLTACGNPPLTAPERTESIAQSEQEAVQAEPTATLAIVGGSADSPLASPTSSAEPTESPTLSPTSPGSRPSETPRPTRTPGPPTQTPRSTRTPPPLDPTATPEPSETATFTPEKPTEKYVFGTPELILVHNYIEIVDWFPGSSHELVIRNFEDDNFLVEILNVNTGERQRLVETPHTIVGDPVILPNMQQIMYLAYDETNMINLYVNDLKDLQRVLVLNDVRPPIVPDKARKNAWVFDAQMSKLLNTEQNIRGTPKFSLPTPLPFQEGGLFTRYQAARNAATDWAAIYNGEKFLLLNRGTDEVREIDLGNGPGDWGPLGALYSTWSSDGQKLAIIAAPEAMHPPVPFTQLLVFNVNTNEIRVIEDDFTFISNVVWTPDNHQLLISAVVGSIDGSNTNALFLVDPETMQTTSLSVMPEGAFGLVSFRSLIWSPDGQTVIVGYTEVPTEGRWYRVSVKSSN